jgi:hypothetical protein
MTPLRFSQEQFKICSQREYGYGKYESNERIGKVDHNQSFSENDNRLIIPNKTKIDSVLHRYRPFQEEESSIYDACLFHAITSVE